MPTYFSHLSREAIIHGAGVVELFFKETEAIRLGQKPAPKLFAEEPKKRYQKNSFVRMPAWATFPKTTGEFFQDC